MSNDESIKEMSLYEKIHAIMAEVGTVAKDGKNDFHGYEYAREADFVNAIRPLLIKYRVCVQPNVSHVGEQNEKNYIALVMTYSLINIDSPEERLACGIPAGGTDKGDKAIYKAITGAKKYFLANTFMIATGDDPEADSKVDKEASKSSKTKKTQSMRQSKKTESQTESKTEEEDDGF